MRTLKLMITTLVAGVVLVSGAASAGSKYEYPVSVSKAADGSGTASGSIGSARASSDSSQSILCYGTGAYHSCWAVDASGKSLGCTSSDAATMAAMRSVGPSSYVYFNVNSAGTCTYFLVETGSIFHPASP
jgi:hypothetical protein